LGAAKPKARRRVKKRSELHQNGNELPMLRNSERSSFRNCRWAWSLSYGRHLQPKTASPPLRYGTLIHKALAAHYIPGKKRGESPVIAFQRFYEEELKVQESFGFRDEDGKWESAGELGVAMMENYIDHFGDDDEWEVLVTEEPFEVVVNHPNCGICDQPILTDKDGSECSSNCPGPKYEPWFLYVGVIDGAWRNLRTKKIWIPDHKTTKGIGPTTVKHLVLDDQAGGYWTWGVDWLREKGYLKPDQKLAGMLYNFLRKTMPDEREYIFKKGVRQYLNKDGTVSQKQPSPYFLRQPIFRDELDKAAARTRSLLDYGEIELVKKGVLTVNKNPGWMTCPNCWAIDICELHEAGHDWEDMIKGTTQEWDPYAEHEVYAGESR